MTTQTSSPQTSSPHWNLTIAYQDLNDPHILTDIQQIEQHIEQLHQLSAQLNSPVAPEHELALSRVLQEAIQISEIATQKLATIYTFAVCYTSVDATNAAAKALHGRMAKLSSELAQAYSPYEHALTYADESLIAAVLQHESGDVAGQAFGIAQLRKLADVMLPVEQEQLLAALEVEGRDAWGRLYDNLTGSLTVTLDTDSGQETIGFSQAASLLYGSEFAKQEAAWRGIQNAMETHQESFASIVNGLAGWRLTEYAKRSYQRKMHFLEPALHESCIQAQTLDVMMAVAREQRHLGQKAGKLMAKVHGLEQMTPWNHLAAMPSLNGEKVQTYTFDQAIAVIKQAFAHVDPEMADFVQLMVDNGWIDAKPSANRRLGAYCTKLANTRTPLVFMTWGGSRSDLLTLAHELGHAFHNWVMRDMPLCQTRYPMTLAETASIFAENVVRDALLAQATTREEQLEMLWEELSSCYALTINIPVRFEFEQAFYEQRQQGELSAEQICDLMRQTWQTWYGDSMAGDDPYFWASKLHFSIAEVSFYNYPYLFGALFSSGVYAQREAKGAQFYPDYVALLRDTGSMMAEEVVEKHLGMDLTQPDFWRQSFARIAAKIEQFEQLLQQDPAL